MKKTFNNLRLKLIHRIFKSFFKIGEFSKLKNADILFLMHDDSRGFNWDGLNYSPLLDTVKDKIESIGISTTAVSIPFSDIRGRIYGKVSFINGLMARAEIINKLKFLFIRNHRFRGEVIKTWSDILDKISPKFIIAIQPPIELCIAAKEKNICVADLQHGGISDDGYYGMKARSKYNQKGWPSVILCWDKNSAEWFNDKAAGIVDTLVIGNPWVLRFIKPSKNDPLVVYSQKKHKKITNGRLKILITLQWGEVFDNHMPTGIPNEVLKIIKNQKLNYDWLVRLHPAYLKKISVHNIYELYEAEFSGIENLYWAHSTESPFPVVLSEVDLHLTFTSSSTIEASWFGVRTALLHDNVGLLLDWYKNEINNGYADIVKLEEKAIENWIKLNLMKKKEVNIDITSVYYESFIKKLKQKIFLA